MVTSGAYVTLNGALDFDISSLTPDAPARINDLSLLKSVSRYTITVSDTQQEGTYRLAEGMKSLKTGQLFYV